MRLCHFIAMTTSRAIFALLGISFSSGKVFGYSYFYDWSYICFLGLGYFLGCVSRLLLSSFKATVGDCG